MTKQQKDETKSKIKQIKHHTITMKTKQKQNNSEKGRQNTLLFLRDV